MVKFSNFNKEDKIKEILDAAVRVFSKKGASGTKIEDIAQEASIAKGTIYLYFKNKKEILKAILHSNKTVSHSDIDEIVSSKKTPFEKLSAIANILVNAAINSGYPPAILLDTWASIIRSHEKKEYANQLIHMRNIINKLIKEIPGCRLNEKETMKLSDSFLAFIHGMIVNKIFFKGEFETDEVIQIYVSTLINGIK